MDLEACRYNFIKIVMKKMFFMLLLMLGIASSAFAQKSESQWNAGVTLGYGTDVSKGFVGVRAMYDIKPAFSLAAGFNYYFKRTLDTEPFEVEGKYWDVNLDFHWNVFRGDAYKLYPLIGLTYLHAKASVAGFSVSDGEALVLADNGISLSSGELQPKLSIRHIAGAVNSFRLYH